MIKPRTTLLQYHAALARLIRPYRWEFSRGLLATAASNGLAVRIPLTFREGIDSIVRHGTSASLLFYRLAAILLTRGKGWSDDLAHQRALHFAARSRWPCPADVALFTRAAGRGWRESWRIIQRF